jgi:hypothetical protein
MKWFPEADTEFQRHWNRTFLTIFLPGFAIFGAGAYANVKPLILAGWAVAAFGVFRGFRLMAKYRRCPSCRRVDYTRLGDDSTCLACGTPLPLNGTDADRAGTSQHLPHTAHRR